ncbi:hypothetical protein [Azospirillum sp.]|uniref:hypothetical protein n=1 Tax=Azospirillum sp. TaxID=34012 RepID=UPI002D407BDF|nr:hypothetical protein [Azospirillum sp.]HYD71443.1 hypothetical protein [Azospirillum sp.]
MTYTVCFCNATNRDDTQRVGHIGPFDTLADAVRLVMERIPAPSRPYAIVEGAAIEAGCGAALHFDEIAAVYQRMPKRELVDA